MSCECKKRMNELERSVIALQLLNDNLTEERDELSKALSAQTHRANSAELHYKDLKDKYRRLARH